MTEKSSSSKSRRAEDATLRAAALANKIKPFLAGQGPGVQSAAMLELVAIWLAGHPPQIRADVFRIWITAVEALVPVCEAEIFRDKPKPW